MFDDAEERQASAPPTRSADESDSEGDSSSSDGEGSGSGGSDDDDAADLVEHIFDSNGKHARPGSATASKPGSQRGAGPAGGAGGLPRTPQQQLAASDAERLRLERKRFMSSKAAVITSGGPGSQPGSQRRRRSGGTPGSALGGEEEGVSREEFLAMQREVQQLGESTCSRSCGLLVSRGHAAACNACALARFLPCTTCLCCGHLAARSALGAATPRVRGSSGPRGHFPAAPATRPRELFPRATRPPRRAAAPHSQPMRAHSTAIRSGGPRAQPAPARLPPIPATRTMQLPCTACASRVGCPEAVLALAPRSTC